jgi:hypothetical protein
MSMPCAHNGQDQDIAMKNHSLCISTAENRVDLVVLNQVFQFLIVYSFIGLTFFFSSPEYRKSN